MARPGGGAIPMSSSASYVRTKNGKFYGSIKYIYRLSKKNTHVLLLVGGNGGDVTRSVSRRVDVHVVVAERIKADLVVRGAFSLLGQPRAAPRLNLLDLGLDIYGWKVTRFFYFFTTRKTSKGWFSCSYTFPTYPRVW